MKARLMAAAAAAVAAAVGVGGLYLYAGQEGGTVPMANDEGATPESLAAVSNGSNQFAFDLYGKLKDEDGNLFFSPWSICTALAMTYEGARGETADEIAGVFHFPQDAGARQPAFGALHNALNAGGKDYQLSVANALWAQEGYPFLPDYLSTVEDYYMGHATNVDFIQATEDARLTINGWVEDRTNDKIKDLFEPGMLDATTRLVLTNAIFFKGKWAKQFDPAETQPGDFHSPSGTVQVPMMRRTDEDAKYGFAEVDGVKILELPYEPGTLCMLVLLPEGHNLDALEAQLTAQQLEQWRTQIIGNTRVRTYLPKFTFNTKYGLNDMLAQLGMPAAFNDATADFSGMDGVKGQLVIQLVVHQAFVDVNEEGTEAAAATGVAMELRSMPMKIPEFRVDHPFIFLIQDKASGTILFMGRVEDPTAA